MGIEFQVSAQRAAMFVTFPLASGGIVIDARPTFFLYQSLFNCSDFLQLQLD